MAERPIFVPSQDAPGLVKVINFEIPWASGFAAIQKQKNIATLHAAAKSAGFSPLLEVSTKSQEKAGQHLSAFHLKVKSRVGEIPLENAFQGSKVFEHGGPFTDLLTSDPRSAKRDPRLQESGQLIAFEFEGNEFPLQPTTVFYDWLYLNAIWPHREWLRERIDGSKYRYAGFTDIEFNPNKSVNCQAKSCALFVSLMRLDELDEAISSPNHFIAMMKDRSTRQPVGTKQQPTQMSLIN